MSVSLGNKLGPYEILAALGATSGKVGLVVDVLSATRKLARNGLVGDQS